MSETVARCQNRHFRTELHNLGEKGIDIVPGYQRVHLIQVAVASYDVQGMGSNRPGGAENGESFHLTGHSQSRCHHIMRRRARSRGGNSLRFSLEGSKPFRAPGRIASGVFYLEVSLALVGVASPAY